MANYDAKQQDIRTRLMRERKMVDGYRSLKAASPNPDVQRDCDKKIKQSAAMIEFFENSLQELDNRSASPSLDSAMASKSLPAVPGSSSAAAASSSSYTGPGHQSRWSTDGKPEQGSPSSPPPASGTPRKKPNYSNLDLVKAETPLTAAKISKMVYQLDFKLTVEKQFKDGLERMAKLYGADGDKKSRLDAEHKRAESTQKMHLLTSALKKYKNLDVMGDLDDDEDNETGDSRGLMRKPLTGALMINVIQAKDLDRPPITSKFGRPKPKPESTVVIKIEDSPRARTHPSRIDRWQEEFEIHVDKANEVEVTIYDKQSASDTPIPIGLLWIRLSDVVEELRRKKAGQDAAGNAAWVTADKVKREKAHGHHHSGSFTGVPPYNQPEAPVGQQMAENHPGTAPPMPGPSHVDGITAWFAVEPEGQIQLHLNFAKSNVRKRPLEAGGLLGRQGAVRKRKGEVHEQNGHKFVLKQFYTVIQCAYCRELLLNAAGMQCEDCKYVCHKKCFNNVVTKCISKSSAETQDSDEEKINHRIPHRFEPLSTLSPNWCCHCGMILPIGRKKARKCSECDLTAHTDCVHLVPDFCGMSMEIANQLLRDIKSINTQKSRLPGKPSLPPGSNALPPSSSAGSGDQLADAAGRMQLEGRPSTSPPPRQSSQQPYSAISPSSQASFGSQQQQRPIQSPPAEQPDPAAAYFQQPQQQQPSHQSRPLPAQPFPQGPPPGAYAGGAAPYQPRPMPPGAARPDQMVRPQQQGYPQQQGPPSQAFPMPQIPQQQQQQQQSRPPPPSVQQPLPTPPQMQRPPSQQQVAVAPPPRMAPKRNIGLDDFNFLAVLGKGNFGKVMLAEEKATSQLYAIKVLKKDFIIENDEIESTKSEKRVFLAAARERHPFLLNLHSAFQTETRIYFCMEFVPGGDLMLHIQRKQFSRKQATFYGAEVLLALEYFHSNGIVYRDLKLDNIMLTLDGHIKLADYGLCKENMWYGNTTNTFCGTPEFMAPEILLESKYGRAVDWWAFGVLIYEMLLGQSPFRGEDEDEIFDSILEDEPLYPIHMPKDSVAILQALLTRDPTRRLGSGDDDAVPIKRHAFFKDIQWDLLLNKQLPPPFYPQVASATDVSNFDSEFTNEKPYLTPVHSQLSAADQREFEGFSWIAPWAGQ